MLQAVADFLFPPECAYCGAAGSGLCDRCFPPGRASIVRASPLPVRALGRYEGALRSAVLALKDGRRDAARALGERLGLQIAGGTRIVPVPTTAQRRRERGFDGCVLMATIAAARCAGTVHNGLAHVRGDAQRGRGRTERLAARGRFAWTGAPLAGERLLLLDDVITTGATLADCAAAIAGAGGIVEGAIVAAQA